MAFIIMLPAGRNIWQLFALLTLMGVGFYFLSQGDKAEADQYKDGPKTADVETLIAETSGAEDLEYDYLKLTGLSDSAYIYSYFSEGKDEETVDTQKAIILYYALLNLEEFDLSIAGEQSRPTVVVRQVVPEEKRACIETEDGCLTGGETTLEGRLSKDPIYPDSDQESLDKLAKDLLYTLDDNTLYFDADWRPKTVEETSGGGAFWIGFSVLWGVATAFTFYRSRRKKAVTPPTQEQA
jgi:hypothetical protein